MLIDDVAREIEEIIVESLMPIYKRKNQII